MKQHDFFSDSIDQRTENFLRIFFRDEDFSKPRPRDKVADALAFYAQEARKTQSGPGLFVNAPGLRTSLGLQRGDSVVAETTSPGVQPSSVGLRILARVAERRADQEIGQDRANLLKLSK